MFSVCRGVGYAPVSPKQNVELGIDVGCQGAGMSY